MSAKHIPGPWVAGCEDDPGSGDVYMEDGSLIAEAFINGDVKTRAANARLIAAAPDLLEALQKAIEFVPTGYGIERQCWEAIDKATGGSA